MNEKYASNGAQQHQITRHPEKAQTYSNAFFPLLRVRKRLSSCLNPWNLSPSSSSPPPSLFFKPTVLGRRRRDNEGRWVTLTKQLLERRRKREKRGAKNLSPPPKKTGWAEQQVAAPWRCPQKTIKMGDSSFWVNKFWAHCLDVRKLSVE